MDANGSSFRPFFKRVQCISLHSNECTTDVWPVVEKFSGLKALMIRGDGIDDHLIEELRNRLMESMFCGESNSQLQNSLLLKSLGYFFFLRVLETGFGYFARIDFNFSNTSGRLAARFFFSNESVW